MIKIITLLQIIITINMCMYVYIISNMYIYIYSLLAVPYWLFPVGYS